MKGKIFVFKICGNFFLKLFFHFGNILLCPLTLGITVQSGFLLYVSLHEFTKSHRLEESEISYVASIVLCRLSGNANFADYVDYVA